MAAHAAERAVAAEELVAVTADEAPATAGVRPACRTQASEEVGREHFRQCDIYDVGVYWKLDRSSNRCHGHTSGHPSSCRWLGTWRAPRSKCSSHHHREASCNACVHLASVGSTARCLVLPSLPRSFRRGRAKGSCAVLGVAARVGAAIEAEALVAMAAVSAATGERAVSAVDTRRSSQCNRTKKTRRRMCCKSSLPTASAGMYGCRTCVNTPPAAAAMAAAMVAAAAIVAAAAMVAAVGTATRTH